MSPTHQHFLLTVVLLCVFLVYPQILKATDLDLLVAVAKKALGCLPPVVTKITMSS